MDKKQWLKEANKLTKDKLVKVTPYGDYLTIYLALDRKDHPTVTGKVQPIVWALTKRGTFEHLPLDVLWENDLSITQP